MELYEAGNPLSTAGKSVVRFISARVKGTGDHAAEGRDQVTCEGQGVAYVIRVGGCVIYKKDPPRAGGALRARTNFGYRRPRMILTGA
ncbi:MAG: hypothetical protein BMS9Abin28_1624 [Anaerolineae bacterium]|nr:MAG: hypothetical protein BMS9Abin28_1624 [Anaerolineae bacterium]